MRRHAVAVSFVLALAAAAPAAGGHPSRTITFWIRSTPANRGPSATCPGGQLRAPILSRSGKPLGTSLVCVLGTSVAHPRDGAPGDLTEQVVETDSLRGGGIVSRQRQVFRFNHAGTKAQATFRGTVIRGTGAYGGATGRVRGGGPMGVVNVSQPNLTVTITLR
jgi:hypothetical protein